MSDVSKSQVVSIAFCTLIACQALIAQEKSRRPEVPAGSQVMPTLAQIKAEIESLKQAAENCEILEKQTISFSSTKFQESLGVRSTGKVHTLVVRFKQIDAKTQYSVEKYEIDGKVQDLYSDAVKQTLQFVMVSDSPMSVISSLEGTAAIGAKDHMYKMAWDKSDALITVDGEHPETKVSMRVRKDNEGRWIPCQYEVSAQNISQHLHWEVQNLEGNSWHSIDYLPKGTCLYEFGDVDNRDSIKTTFEVIERSVIGKTDAPVSDSLLNPNDSQSLSVPPKEIQSQITQLEVELAVQKLKLGAEHPSIKSLEERIAALRKTEESEPKPPVTVLPLRNAKATDVAEKFKQLALGPVDAIVVDERTNSLMIRGTERQIKDIEQLIEVLDAEVSPAGYGQAAQATTPADGPTADGASPLGRGRFGGRSALAETPIGEYRRRLNDLEKPVLDLAEKVRAAGTSLGKEHPEYQKLLADLRALIQQTFATRQDIQRAELAEFTRRLQSMQQSIETREKIVEKIVDRRMEELLNPETNWNSLSALPREATIESENSPRDTESAKSIPKNSATVPTFATPESEGMIRQSGEPEDRLSSDNTNGSAASGRSPESVGTDDLIIHVIVLEGSKLAADETILGFAIRNQLVTRPAADRLQELVTAKKMIVSIDSNVPTKHAQQVDLAYGAAKDDSMSITPLEEDGRPAVDISIVEATKRFGGTENKNGKSTQTVRHEFRVNLRSYGGSESLFYFDMGGWIRLVRLSVKKGSETGSDVSPDRQQIAAEKKLIRCKTVEAEVKIRLPVAGSQFVYWNGLPVHSTNRVIFAPDVVANIDIIKEGIDSLTVYANRSSYPARVIATKSSPNLLMVELDTNVEFESSPFNKQDLSEGERIQACRNGMSYEYFALEVSEVKAGVQPVKLDKALPKWTGTVFLDRTLEKFVGLGSTNGELVPASELAQWSEIPMSTVGVLLISDRSLELTVADEPTRASSTSATFEIPAHQSCEVQLSKIHGADDLNICLSIEPRCSMPEARELLNKHKMHIELKDADIEQLQTGNMVIKALYIAPESNSVRAIANFAVGAGMDPVFIAAGHGIVIGVVRMARATPTAAVLGNSESAKSTPKNSAAIPTFATPDSVLAHLDSASTSGDFGVIADCLSEDESRRFAGILLHQSSMMSTISLIAARVSNDSSQLAEDASAITAMAIVLKSSMVPDPPADAKAAYDKLTASFVNIFASQPASFDPDEFLQLLIKSTGILKDHRAFIRDMGKAMSEIDDKAKNAESPFGAAKPQWNVVIDGIDGDHATATDLRERKPGANLLTPATTEIQLDRIDGDWKISKLFGDEIIKQLAAGPQVSPSETDSSK